MLEAVKLLLQDEEVCVDGTAEQILPLGEIRRR